MNLALKRRWIMTGILVLVGATTYFASLAGLGNDWLGVIGGVVTAVAGLLLIYSVAREPVPAPPLLTASIIVNPGLTLVLLGLSQSINGVDQGGHLNFALSVGVIACFVIGLLLVVADTLLNFIIRPFR